MLVTLPVRAQVLSDTLIDGRRALERLHDTRQKIDSLLDKRDDRGRRRVDTLYLQRMPQRLRLKLMLNGSGTEMRVKGRNDNGSYTARLSAQNKYTVSIGASYRGLSAALSINPAHLAGKNNDYEFNMNAYSNKFGADVIYSSAKTYKGDITSDAGEVSVPAGSVSQKQLSVNAYYVFNSRRFSYPAAFTQSWIQKRSAGGFMLGVSFVGGEIESDVSQLIGKNVSNMSYANVGVGCGYAYNLVLRGKWLIHLSSLPELVVFSRGSTTNDGQKVRMPYTFPNIIAVGRIAVVRHFKRYYAGMTAVVNTSTIGDKKEMQLATTKWRARLFVGLKL